MFPEAFVTHSALNHVQLSAANHNIPIPTRN